MALASAGFYCSVLLKDAAGNVGGLRWDIQGADIATAKTNAAAIIASLDAITDAVVFSYSVGEKFDEDATFYGAAGSEVENLASVVTQLEGTPIKYHTFRVPAPVDGIFQGAQGPQRNQVDVDDAALVTYINHFTDETAYGVPGPDAIALVSDGEKVEPDNINDTPEIVSGKRIHRASTKG